MHMINESQKNPNATLQSNSSLSSKNKQGRIEIVEDSSARKIDLTETAINISTYVTSSGWTRYNSGESSAINYNHRFDLYVRRRNLRNLLSTNDDISIKSSNVLENTNCETSIKLKGIETLSKAVSNAPMGLPQKDLTPSIISSITRGSENLPVLSDFSSYPSLAAVRTNTPAIVIAFDSEWYYMVENGQTYRNILSWQFSLIDGEDLVEYVFIRKSEKYALNLEFAIARILEHLSLQPTDVRKIRKYEAIIGKDKSTDNYVSALFETNANAMANSKYLFHDGKKVHIKYDWSDTQHIPVVLLCHSGKVDVSGFDQRGKYSKDVLKYCSEVQGGLISLQPVRIYARSVNPKFTQARNTHIYPVSLQVADTMCHAPAKMKSLKTLGEAVGWKKVQLNDGEIEHMDQLFMNDPCFYLEYASNDSNVTLLYESALYGYNNKPPVTITSATAKVMREVMMNYLGCSNSKEFNLKYRGLKTVGHGLVPRNDRPGYIESTSLEPISDKANTIQYYASQAYHGGYNSSSEIGYFSQITFDYDLLNAYLTAMCLVADINWENPIRTEIVNRDLTLQDFVVPIIGGYAPLTIMIAYVRFEFPSDVKYPCIPVNVDGIPIYPASSEGIDGVYACGPELFLALKLGATIFVERGYILNNIINAETGKLSYSLRSAVKQLVEDRNRAKAEHGKKSLEELILKTMGNSGYGKTAQNVVQKTSWTAYKDVMEDLGCSSITNPVSACMITSIVRAELLAAQNQCHTLGYMTCSVTTDGFIADIPEDTLKSLDLYGFRLFIEQARLFLTNGESAEIWEIKHCQDDLVNFTTRGNVSLYCKKNPMLFNGKEYEGVCAHNSTKSGYPSDSYEDRIWLMTSVLGRTGTVDYEAKEWTNFKELVQGKDFIVKNTVKHIRMDYDMKRKPARDTFFRNTVTIEGVSYEIANFTTLPFKTTAEYKEYRQRKSTVSCLRTMDEWSIFWFKTDAKSTNVKVRDTAWAVLNSCVMGHRARFWNIPMLDELQGNERNTWINSHNTSTKIWTSNDWKNAGRNSRQANMLPREMLEEKLKELIDDYK